MYTTKTVKVPFKGILKGSKRKKMTLGGNMDLHKGMKNTENNNYMGK